MPSAGVHLHHRDDAQGSTLGIWILLLHVQKCQKSDSWLIIFKLGWIHPDTSLRPVAAAAAGWRARPQISPGGRHGGSKKPGREGGKCSQQPSSDPALRSLNKICGCLFVFRSSCQWRCCHAYFLDCSSPPTWAPSWQRATWKTISPLSSEVIGRAVGDLPWWAHCAQHARQTCQPLP